MFESNRRQLCRQLPERTRRDAIEIKTMSPGEYAAYMASELQPPDDEIARAI